MSRHAGRLAGAAVTSFAALLLAASSPALADEEDELRSAVPQAKASVPAAPPPAAGAAAVEVAPSPRYFGITWGGLAGVVGLDLQVSHFYAFVGVPLPLDIFNHENIVTGSVGLGATFALPRDRRWRFDIYAFGVPAVTSSGFMGSSPDHLLALGVGAGFHFTSEWGYTLGIKAPIFGTAVSLDGQPFDDAVERAASFYALSLIALPVITFGYRF